MIIRPRSEKELSLMRKSGWITARALKKTLRAVKPGISLVDLDKIAEREILMLSGEPSFKTVPRYYWTTCLTINDEVVHGTPREVTLKAGDIVSIDLGTVYQGWHTDAAWSVIVRDQQSKVKDQKKLEQFLKIGENALWKGIEQAVDGNRIGDISEAIQKEIEGNGYSVVRSLVGHGVGERLHEEPEVPGFGQKGTGMLLVAGMTLAIEAIYTLGSFEVILDNDGWTVKTRDGSLGGLFEMTIVVGKDKAEVLTDWRKD